MGFRFRKTIKLLPGVKLNISKSGVSTSIGRPGATVNIKKGRKTKATIGIPGTGMSYSSGGGSNPSETESRSMGIGGWIVAAVAVYVVYKVVSLII